MNQSGKLTARSMMDMLSMLFIYVEQLEEVVREHQSNFEEIEGILVKLESRGSFMSPEELAETPPEVVTFDTLPPLGEIARDVTDALLQEDKTIHASIEIEKEDTIAPGATIPKEMLIGGATIRKEEIRLKRIENMKKAREARKAKQQTPQS